MATRVRGTSKVTIPLIALHLRDSQRAEALCPEHGNGRSQLMSRRRKNAASSSEVVATRLWRCFPLFGQTEERRWGCSFQAAPVCVYFRQHRRLSALNHAEGGNSC